MPFDTYKTYIALKNHFTQPNYDYQKYCGKIKASVQSFYKRKDRFWFEKLSRNKTDKEIEHFFVSNFVMASDPANLWVGNIIREGDRNYTEWQRKIQSLSYVFKEETEKLFSENKFEEIFDCKNGHPKVLKSFLSGKDFDKKLKDPIWEIVSLKMKKYSPFLNIDVFRYKKILKEIVVGDQ